MRTSLMKAMLVGVDDRSLIKIRWLIISDVSIKETKFWLGGNSDICRLGGTFDISRTLALFRIVNT